ncbi:MAG: peptidylprolyl isomerase [Acidimicrobiaceae bacterium]|nr:peptidylprolyl isomerase [Acidimicrobiaceae bacterium]
MGTHFSRIVDSRWNVFRYFRYLNPFHYLSLIGVSSYFKPLNPGFRFLFLAAFLPFMLVSWATPIPKRSNTPVAWIEYKHAQAEYHTDAFHSHLVALSSEGLFPLSPSNGSAISKLEVASWLTRWAIYTSVGLEMNDRDLLKWQVEFDSDDSIPPVYMPELSEDLTAELAEWLTTEIPDVWLRVKSEEVNHMRALCSSHILIESEEAADDVIRRLDEGKKFEEVVSGSSSDAASSVEGGFSGCFVEGSLTLLGLDEYEKAVYAVEPGEITKVVTESGVHVIKVHSSGLLTRAGHPQLTDEELGTLILDAKYLFAGVDEGYRELQNQVEHDRCALEQELIRDAFTNYSKKVDIDDRYGIWDAESFTVIPRSSSTAYHSSTAYIPIICQ